MRLAPFNKAAPTAPAEPPACYRAHRAIPGPRCASCGLDVERGPYDAEQWIRNFGVERVYGPSKPDVGRAAEPSAAHQTAKEALELADAVYQAVVSRFLDVTRRLNGPRTADENEELKASELAVKARVRFNAEERLRARRIQAATAKAEGRS